jgi:hypothetical protein
MAQSDRIVQNATFPTVRADINDNLAALFSQNSGNSAPADPVEYQFWINTNVNPPVWNIYKGGNWRAIGTIDTTFAVGGLTAIANGGTGQTTASAAINALLPSQSGQSGKYLGTNGTVASWENILSIVAGTAVPSTSGTSIDFTGLPSGVKRVTVMFDKVSTNGTSPPRIQIGDSGGIETTGYNCGNFGVATAVVVNNYTSGFVIGLNTITWSASRVISGSITLTLLDATSNTWSASGSFALSDTALMLFTAGSKSLSATLDRVRIGTIGGANTFDAGSINILYEG